MEDQNRPDARSLREKVADYVSSLPPRSGPRLSFPDQCAAYAALQAGFEQRWVRQAFGLSAASVSFLSSCAKERRPTQQKHYQHVAREYQRLGDKAFFEAYFRDEHWTKMERIKHDFIQPGDKRTRSGPNPNADKLSYAVRGAFPLVQFAGEEIERKEYWRIDWIDGGWRYHVCSPRGELIGDMGYQGIDSMSATSQPFRTSTLAYEGLEKMLGLRE